MKRVEAKLARLRAYVKALDSAAVAFSGGADSSLVALIAKEQLGECAIAITIDSPMFPASELASARETARRIGIEHIVANVDALKDTDMTANRPDRCYLCKRAFMTEVRKTADKHDITHVLDGSNVDDQKDYRPGTKAKDELGVESPLANSKLTKSDIVAISKILKLPTADKRPSPCLASRIPYGEPITREKLSMIEEAEDFLRAKGLDEVRVRMHGMMARIEVQPKDIERLTNPGNRISIVKKFKSLGFSYVSMDMEGYRMGSLNEVLNR